MMHPAPLIIFDMDGTLVDSSITIANAINYVRERLALPKLPSDLILSKINDHHVNPAEYFYAAERFEPLHEQWFSEYYSANHDQELRLYDGVVELLRELKARDHLLALATNAYRRSTLESLQHLGLDNCFDSVVCYDDVARGKPYPDMLYKVLGELETARESALFIGDGARDEAAADHANMRYMMVDWGFSDHHPEKDAIKTVEELRSILKSYAP